MVGMKSGGAGSVSGGRVKKFFENARDFLSGHHDPEQHEREQRVSREQRVDEVFGRFIGTKVPYMVDPKPGLFFRKPLHGNLADNSVSELSELFKTAQENGYKVRLLGPTYSHIKSERAPPTKDCVDVYLAPDQKETKKDGGNFVVNRFRIG